MSMLKLPVELITRILFHLGEVKEVNNARMVNKEWYRLSNDDTLWDLFIRRDYPFYFDHAKNDEQKGNNYCFTEFYTFLF